MPRSVSRSRSPSRSRSRSRARSPARSRTRSPVKRRSITPETSEQKGIPFLIRIFVSKGKHTPMADFDEGNLPVRDEFQVYGWKTSTPTSLIQLLLPSFPPPYRSPMARYSFRHIYVDASPRGLYRHKDLVSFTGRELMHTVLPSSAHTSGVHKDRNGKAERGLEMEMELDEMPVPDQPDRGRGFGGKKVEEKTLEQYGFVTGDLISVSLFIPEPRGLRRPTMGGDATGAAAGPGAGANAGGGATGRPGDFGWNGVNPAVALGNAGAGRVTSAADQTGPWERGAPLPPQNATRPGAGERGSIGGAGGAPGGRWGRGGHVGAAQGGRDRGEERPGRGRSRSPDYRNGARSRSRSPVRDRDVNGNVDRRKREGWNTRR